MDGSREEDGRTTRWRRKDVQIVEAAEQIFLGRGYAEGSMHAIAQEAGVSKQTLYHHYTSKADLFAAVVDTKVERLLRQLQAEVVEHRPPREALTALGRQFLEMVIAPSSVALHRALVTEVPRQPGLGRTTYEHGPKRAVAMLADYLRQQTAEGALRVEQPELAAEQFFGMTLGHSQLRALFGIAERTAPTDIDAQVAAAVEVFLAAYLGTPANGCNR